MTEETKQEAITLDTMQIMEMIPTAQISVPFGRQNHRMRSG